MVKSIGGEINSQDLNDNFSELDSQKLGKSELSYVNIKDYGAIGGIADDTASVQAAVTDAINNGIKAIFIPFDAVTVSSVDCEGLSVLGSGTTISGVLKNVYRFEGCSINGFSYDDISLMDSTVPVSSSTKLVEKYTDSRYNVFTKKPASDDYLLYYFEKGIVTTTNSVGGSGELMRPTSVYNLNKVIAYKHTYQAKSGTWEELTYSADPTATTYRDLKYWKNSTSPAAGNYMEFQTTIAENGEFSLLFFSTPSSDPAATVKVDGVTVGTVRLNNFDGKIMTRKFQAPPGGRVIRIEASGSYFICVAGINAYDLKDAPVGLGHDSVAFWGNSNHYIYNKGAMEYAFYDADLGQYYGSYHGGETALSSQLLIDNKFDSMFVGEVLAVRSFGLRQKTDINGKFTSNTLYQLKGDGLLELSVALDGDANVSTLYNCMATVSDSFTDVVYPKQQSITTDGEVYFGRTNKIVQENPATGQRVSTFFTLFKNDNNSKGGVFIRRTAGAYNKVYYGRVVQSLENVKELSYQTKWLFE